MCYIKEIEAEACHVTRAIAQREGPRDQSSDDTRLSVTTDSQRPNDPPPIDDRPPTKRHNTATLRVSGKTYFRLWKRAMKKAI
ncbi:hypothetical protein GGH13_004071 [Coemansia sp. S155-1]|nr:hypothetical protein GGH13_004071 [Coemansia sp. S155-1]